MRLNWRVDSFCFYLKMGSNKTNNQVQKAQKGACSMGTNDERMQRRGRHSLKLQW
jgi:hypothetical protein